MPLLLGAWLLVVLGVATPADANAWSAIEQRLAVSVKARKGAALAELKQAVAINSGTLNVEGVREVGRHYQRQFEELGFTTRWVEMPAAMQRAGHLVAVLNDDVSPASARGKRLLLLGHLDTVFEKDSPAHTWREDDDGRRIWGQGVADMKGGNTVMLEALRALKSAGVLDGMTIRVMLTGDEERVGHPIEVARAAMIELARQSDIALSFEGQTRYVDGSEQVAIARRASGGWTLDVKGRQGHSSGIFGPLSGYGAAFEIARIINAFREELREPGLTFSVGTLLAGTEVEFDPAQARGSVAGKNNIIPPQATARGDLRYLDAAQGARAREGMARIVASSLPATSASIRFNEAYPPMAATPGNERLARLYSEASMAAGFGAVGVGDPALRGAGDVQFVAPHVDGIDGLGAAGGGAHTTQEFLYVDSLEKNAIRAAVFMYRLTR
jgi:glutamate carboxypeptidase